MDLISDKIPDLKKKKIQVFLATYNRPHLVQNAIDSILNQSFDSFDLIISDNSTNDETKAVVERKYYNKATYIHRIPTTPDHFNKILKEVDSEYFMIFHDDDAMLPDMLKELYEIINQDKKIFAVGANAFLNINGRTTKKKVFRNSNLFRG